MYVCIYLCIYQVKNFSPADPDYGARIAKLLQSYAVSYTDQYYYNYTDRHTRTHAQLLYCYSLITEELTNETTAN